MLQVFVQLRRPSTTVPIPQPSIAALVLLILTLDNPTVITARCNCYFLIPQSYLAVAGCLRGVIHHNPKGLPLLGNTEHPCDP
ncbi:hypothetical protein K440DRAFT_633938 [Wilcoxina mikolae CBS 423.85]|nr:hypothetical protein K440DRAFT_633938 [Wilcoxina mikolae CBS 423.85]